MKYTSIFLCGILCLLSSCKKKCDNSNIEYIKATYYNYILETAVAIDCDDITVTELPSFEKVLVYDSEKEDSVTASFIDCHAVFDTTITEQSVLKELENELLQLKPDNSMNNIDARISVLIKYKDGKEDRLCIGGVFTNVISYNGKIQLPQNKLLYLIKNNIGYYSWISNEDLEYMDELKDTSFKKDPFVETSYFKQYLKAKSEEE